MTSHRHKEAVATRPRTPEDDYLDAARTAILAVGWSRSTLTDIARRAGVSRMTLYRRWPDTQTLLADLMTREWGLLIATAVDDVGIGDRSGDGTSALARIRHGVVATVRALRENALLRRIVDVDPELLLPYLLDRRGRSQDLLAHHLAGLVAEGQGDGSVRAGDPDLLARAVLLACHGFTLSAHTMLDAADSRAADVSHLDHELGVLVERYLRA